MLVSGLLLRAVASCRTRVRAGSTRANTRLLELTEGLHGYLQLRRRSPSIV
jgi:hypothetical protein